MRAVESEEVLVLDLDGTLLPYNSFHRWLTYLLRSGLPGAPLVGRLNVGMQVARRAVRQTSHQQMKLALMQAWQHQANVLKASSSESAQHFAATLHADFRRELIALITEARARGVPCLLATAAPGDYATALAQTGLFDSVLCTRIAGEELDECRFERKRDRVLEEMKRMGLGGRPIAFATDHRDDHALCLESAYIYWYGSNKEWQNLQESGALVGEVRPAISWPQGSSPIKNMEV